MFSSNASQVSTAANYIEDVFSTYLYTGTGATQTITNNINLSTNGGLVWTKRRNAAGYGNYFIDTARGVTKAIDSTTTAAEATYADSLTAFTTSGYTLGADTLNGGFNNGAGTYVGWTFQKQSKFFDIVTYAGNSTNRTIAHNLGSPPGCIIIKRTDAIAPWPVYHSDVGAGSALFLNTTGAATAGATYWNSTNPTSTVFSLGTNTAVNATGGTYVAYLFASNAGGFGVTGSDNVITCGSFLTDASGKATITLGYEPQIVIYKRSSGATGDWWMYDVIRGLTVSLGNNYLRANSTSAEGTDSTNNFISPTATGFTMGNTATVGNNGVFVYIAIRRGPMKTPTSGTSVFSPASQTVTAGSTINPGFPSDMTYCSYVAAYNTNYMNLFQDRLRGYATANTSGTYSVLCSNTTDTDTALSPGNPVLYGINNSQTNISFGANAATGKTQVYAFRRAPGFFDVVCYTGTGSATTVSHNLGAVPELMIVKNRVSARIWAVYSASLLSTEFLRLDTIDAKSSVNGSTYWNSTRPTASVFSVGTNAATNANSLSDTYVAYLFATVAGVSKVGSYTGTAALQTIDCGFSAGARFVLIKRTDSTGDWYVWDSARGISSGNDPYLLLNSTAAEVTGTNYVDTTSVGFQVTAAAPAGINASGGSYIFLAVS